MTSAIFKRAEFYALIAAALNGTIGTLTRIGFVDGASHHQIAFWKCFIAFLILSTFCAFSAGRRNMILSLREKWLSFAILAFLGIFCLYFFETWAFHEASIPLVSFLTYAAGGITLMLSAIFLGEKTGLYKLAAFTFIILGTYLIYHFEGNLSGSYLGIGLALLGGLGYALFIFVSKLLKVGSGIAQLVWLFGFGSLYLAIPLWREGIVIPSGFAFTTIMALVIFPTIGGFYFTTKAVDAGEASKVQIIETSDPLFSTLFAFSVFGDRLGLIGSIGAACIMVGLILAMKKQQVANVAMPAVKV